MGFLDGSLCLVRLSASGESGVAARGPVRRPSEPRPSGGVDLVMSPQVELCEASWRESSVDGFCHAELARREPGWILLRWARIAQAGPWRARRGAGCAPSHRPGPAPTRSRPRRPRAVAGPAPIPARRTDTNERADGRRTESRAASPTPLRRSAQGTARSARPWTTGLATTRTS